MAEYWDIYDRDRRLTGRRLRRGEAVGPEDYVLVVNIWLRNARGEWLITKRAPNKSQPLKWEPPGGHVLAGENSLEGALREFYEETGIRLRPEEGELFAAFRRAQPSWENSGFLDIWVFEKDVPLEDVVLQEGETIDARWATQAEILEMIAGGEFVPMVVHPYYRELFARYGGAR